MDKIKIERTWLQGTPVQVDNLMGNAFIGEAQAHEFLISGKDDAGNVVPITGTITGKFLSSTMTTFALSGYVTEGVASVTLPSECYGAPGQFVVSIFATNGSTTTCIYCGVGSIFRTSTAAIAYPTTTLPDLTLLINQLDDVIASFPADLSHLLGAIAPTFVDNQPFYAGQYVWNNQVLYRFTVDHPAGSWAGSADTVEAVVGTELNSTVRYTQQVLTDAQKTVARTNIDAADADDVTDLELTTVQVTPQTFDDNSKSQARSNIGAASSGDLSTLSGLVSQQGGYISDLTAAVGTVPAGETVEGQITDLKSAIGRNAVALADDNNVIARNMNPKTSTVAGVECVLEGDTVTMTGTATQANIFVMIGSLTVVPSCVIRGRTYAVVVELDESVRFTVQQVMQDNTNENLPITESGTYVFTLSTDAKGLRFGVMIDNGKTYNAAKCTFRVSDIIYRDDIDYLRAIDSWRYYGKLDQLGIHWTIGPDNVWGTINERKSLMIPVTPGDEITFTANSNRSGYYALLTEDNHLKDKYAAFVEGTSRVTVAANTSVSFTVPETCSYLYVLVAMSSTLWYLPASLIINGVDLTVNVRAELQGVKESLEENAVGINRYSISGSIKSSGNWGDVANGNSSSLLIPVSAGDVIAITAGIISAYYSLLTNADRSDGASASFVDGTERTSIAKGTTVTVTIPETCNYICLLDDIYTTSKILKYRPKSIVLNGAQLGEGLWGAISETQSMIQAGSTLPFAIYKSGSFDGGNATEQLMIFRPVGDHFVAWEMRHYVVQDINCDCWRIYMAYRFNNDLETYTRLLNPGELECAVRLEGRSDFSGGSTHGDEVMTGYDIFLDGQKITDDVGTVLADYTGFSELRFVRQSNLYDPSDSTTIIADHGCEYVYTAEGLKINQSLKWRNAYNLWNCFLAMFTPSKNVTDHVYTDLDFTPTDLTGMSSFSIPKENVKKTVIYGDNAAMEVAIERYPTGKPAGGGKWSCSDNSGKNYNKIYYYIAKEVSSGQPDTCQANELWQSTTVYKIHA